MAGARAVLADPRAYAGVVAAKLQEARRLSVSGVPCFRLEGLEAKLVCANAGDLLLWDSRTVHCNTPSLPGEPLKRFIALNASPSSVSVHGKRLRKGSFNISVYIWACRM